MRGFGLTAHGTRSGLWGGMNRSLTWMSCYTGPTSVSGAPNRPGGAWGAWGVAGGGCGSAGGAQQLHKGQVVSITHIRLFSRSRGPRLEMTQAIFR